MASCISNLPEKQGCGKQAAQDMAWKPISYSSGKSIIQFLPVNKRLAISRQCRSLRSAEKAAPLHIDTLRFNKREISIDDTSYQLVLLVDVDKSSPTFRTSFHRWNRVRGGLDCDVDEFLHDAPDGPPTPGDIYLSDDIWRDPSDYRVLMPAIFQAFIQLTVKSPRGNEAQKTPYTFKLWEAEKSLTNGILGGRTGTIYVKKLEIWTGGIIRLPEGLKLNVKMIDWTTDTNLLTNLQPILEHQNLDVLHFDMGYADLKDFQLPLMKNAKKWIVRLPTKYYDHLEKEEYLKALPKHVEVTVRSEDGWDWGLDPVMLVRQWIRDDKEIGTFFSISYNDDGRFDGFFEFLRDAFVVDEMIDALFLH